MHGTGGPSGRPADAETRRRVHELVGLRMASDIPGLLKLFVEDVELSYNCAKLFPAGHWRGIDALREDLRRREIDFQPLEAEIKSILVDGERTAVRWTSRWHHRGTGVVSPVYMAHFFRWRKGRIAEMTEFVDLRCASQTADRFPGKLEELASPRDPGLSREEMARRVTAMGSFPRGGPDPALLRSLCAPDIVCEFVGDRKSIFYAGRHRGVDAFVNIVRSIGVEFEQVGSTIPEMVVEQGCVAARRTVEWRHRGTGRSGIVELADFTRFEDGLIVELIEFRDSVALLRMQD